MTITRHVSFYLALLLLAIGGGEAALPAQLDIGLLIPSDGVTYNRDLYQKVCNIAKDEMTGKLKSFTGVTITYNSFYCTVFPLF